ncbi:Protein of unknown function [Pseudobacteriovorax antillogorgiicola]|uniref:DUF1223 domain-containing protein n=1 Tax=Pseudobacteriovorax antillogorgiicola TaxID=1513793 RepID=A0A1Y6CH77_9BACT|nr:uncharacterized protein DUF1223 [Pseudobacteriovorax antillogorgiicola]SMF62002.1 Protein of unknown function [Pseudobacteriovorax antillogorgiicola]
MVLLGIFFIPSPAKAQVYESRQFTPLVELFTSEGCSSCPPAENWMFQIGKNQSLFKTFNAIEFHVDYWDYLGWKDPFSHKLFSKRQRDYVRQKYMDSVATPTVLVQGKAFYGWRRQQPLPKAKQASLPIKVVQNGDQFKVSVILPKSDKRQLLAHGSYLSRQLTSKVSHGENAGRTLNHDLIALSLSTKPLQSSKDGWQTVLNLKENRVAPHVKQRAFVIWISEAGRQMPLQSIGAMLPQKSTRKSLK